MAGERAEGIGADFGGSGLPAEQVVLGKVHLISASEQRIKGLVTLKLI